MKLRIVAIPVIVALVSASAFAEDFPAPQVLVKKYMDAAGGKAAMAKVKSRIDKGKLTLPDMGMEATYTAYTQPPNSLNISDFSGQGLVKNGTTDGTSWTINPFQGNTKNAGARPAEIFPFANLDAIAGSAKTIAEEEVGGKPAFKVEFQLPNGGPLTVFFDKESGLVAASETKNADGVVSRTTIGDYKKVGDLQIPHSITQEGGAFKLVITSESVELNAEIPAGTFDLPEEIKTLP